jgi:hypothetical protein
MSPKNLHKDQYNGYATGQSDRDLRVNLVVYALHLERCEVETSIDHVLDGHFGGKDVVPAEDEADKITKLLPAKFELLPYLRDKTLVCAVVGHDSTYPRSCFGDLLHTVKHEFLHFATDFACEFP